MVSLVLCLVFLIGWIVGVVMGSRERNRQRKEIKELRYDLKAWKNAAQYWQQKSGFCVRPESRIVRQRPLTERLNMVNEEEAAAARMAWGDQVQAEEFLAEVDDEWEAGR